jgi:hypothetical protein
MSASHYEYIARPTGRTDCAQDERQLLYGFLHRAQENRTPTTKSTTLLKAKNAGRVSFINENLFEKNVAGARICIEGRAFFYWLASRFG